MTIRAFEGVAGAGKTVNLIAALEAAAAETPLRDGQRVLALTFMHGARKRLHDRLRGARALRGQDTCITIDSFAQRLTRRWRGLCRALGTPLPPAEEFTAHCDLAGRLLEEDQVTAWVAASFPIVIVDEAQDLTHERLRIVRALAESCTLLVAADEFQCLDARLNPNPCVTWVRGVCEPTVLAQVHRTRQEGPLQAAASIRDGRPPADGGAFRIFVAPSVPMAAAYVASAIAWAPVRASVAVITPSMAGDFAVNVVRRVGEGPCGTRQHGPYTIRWESSVDREAADLANALLMDDLATVGDAARALAAIGRTPVVRLALQWLRRQERAAGVATVRRVDVVAVLARAVTSLRNFSGAGSTRLPAMTVQQAKNREFDDVVVLWPFQTGGQADHKRRLLYNAVTRARRKCTVILQGERQRLAAPFA
jgi:hypothetical protein